jgi:hypothetical protein
MVDRHQRKIRHDERPTGIYRAASGPEHNGGRPSLSARPPDGNGSSAAALSRLLEARGNLCGVIFSSHQQDVPRPATGTPHDPLELVPAFNLDVLNGEIRLAAVHGRFEPIDLSPVLADLAGLQDIFAGGAPLARLCLIPFRAAPAPPSGCRHCRSWRREPPESR